MPPSSTGTASSVFGRQLLGDVPLEPAQHVRRDRLAQRREALGVALVLDGLAPEAPERELVAEQAGREPVEDRPQLAQVVFDRRARQAHAVARDHARERAACLAPGVLDRLRLVEHDGREAQLGEPLLVADHDGIRRDHDVGLRRVGPPPVPLGPVQDDDAELRREARELARPVAHEAWSADDERRRVEAALGLLDPEVGDRLERLAETHLVGQHAADAALAKALEERDALALVGPQRRAQAPRDLDARAAQRPGPARGSWRPRGRST